MRFEDYAEFVGKTAIHPLEMPRGAHKHMAGLLYCATKLCGESGEVAEKIGKALRDDGGQITKDRKNQLELEVGDVLWYVVRLCDLLGIHPDRDWETA